MLRFGSQGIRLKEKYEVARATSGYYGIRRCPQNVKTKPANQRMKVPKGLRPHQNADGGKDSS